MICSLNDTPIAPSAMIGAGQDTVGEGLAQDHEAVGSLRAPPTAPRKASATCGSASSARAALDPVAAFGEHIAAVRNPQRRLGVLLDHQDRDADCGETTQVARRPRPTTSGASPAVGSSSMITAGSVISARAIASIWRWPPDSTRAVLRRLAASAGKRA